MRKLFCGSRCGSLRKCGSRGAKLLKSFAEVVRKLLCGNAEVALLRRGRRWLRRHSAPPSPVRVLCGRRMSQNKIDRGRAEAKAGGDAARQAAAARRAARIRRLPATPTMATQGSAYTGRKSGCLAWGGRGARKSKTPRTEAGRFCGSGRACQYCRFRNSSRA